VLKNAWNRTRPRTTHQPAGRRRFMAVSTQPPHFGEAEGDHEEGQRRCSGATSSTAHARARRRACGRSRTLRVVADHAPVCRPGRWRPPGGPSWPSKDRRSPHVGECHARCPRTSEDDERGNQGRECAAALTRSACGGPGGSGLCRAQLVEEGGAVDEDPRQTARTDKPRRRVAGGDGEDQAPTLDPLERASALTTLRRRPRQVVELHP